MKWIAVKPDYRKEYTVEYVNANLIESYGSVEVKESDRVSGIRFVLAIQMVSGEIYYPVATEDIFLEETQFTR